MSIADILAKPAQIIAAPAKGDIVRPIAPLIAANEPIFWILIPKDSAYGVIASLKDNEATSPDPVTIASSAGPIVAPIPAILGLEIKKFINNSSVPKAYIPDTKTVAVIIIPKILE